MPAVNNDYFGQADLVAEVADHCLFVCIDTLPEEGDWVSHH